MSSDTESNGRDSKGRFAKGNPGGPGGSRRKAFVLRKAIEEAITEEHVEAIVRRATRMALEGDLGAMHFVLDRVCGRASEAPKSPEPVPVALPRLNHARDCQVAIDRLLEKVVHGSVDRDSAKLLVDVITARLKSIEVSELEERLAQLEKATESVSPGRRNGGRL
jgi:hypothetical protein